MKSEAVNLEGHRCLFRHSYIEFSDAAPRKSAKGAFPLLQLPVTPLQVVC